MANLTINPLAGYTQSSVYKPLKFESLADRIRQINETIAAQKKSNLDISQMFTTPSLPPKSAAIKNIAMTPEGEMMLPFDIGRPLGQAEARQMSIPEGYAFEPGDPSSRWVDPSIKAFLGALPEDIGGGQFVVDPEQADKIIKSARGYDSVEDATLRGGLSSRLFQIDHIVPLWAGGVDTRANKQLLDMASHVKKTQVDAVARALYYNEDISLNAARVMAINWKDKNTDGITLDDKIETPLEVAKAKYKEWQKPPKFGFMDIVKGLPEAAVEVGRAVESLLPTPAQSAIEGVLSGFTGGWFPTTAGNEQFIFAPDDFEPSKASQTADKVARYIGSVGGTILGFIALKGVVSALGSMMGLTQAWNASRIAQQPLLRLKGADYITRNITLKGILENMGLFALHGAVSRPEVENFTEWTKDRLKDLGTGAFFGAVSPIPNKFTSTAVLGTGIYTINKLDGASDADALLNAITISGLHLMFRWQMPKETREAYIQNDANKKAINFRNEQLGIRPKEKVALSQDAVKRALYDVASKIEMNAATKAGKVKKAFTYTMEGANTKAGNAIRAINPSTIESQGQFYTQVKNKLQSLKIDTSVNLKSLMQTTTDFFDIFMWDKTGRILKDQYPIKGLVQAKIAAQKATEAIKLTRQDLLDIARGVPPAGAAAKARYEAKIEAYKTIAAVPELGTKTLRSYGKEFMEVENDQIRHNIAKKWQSGQIDDIQAELLRAETIASAKQLYKQTLPRNARWIEDMRDLFSLGVKVKKAPTFAQTGIPDGLAFYMENNVETAGRPSTVSTLNVSSEIQTKITAKNLTGEMSITGIGKGGYLLGDDLVTEANKNLIEAAKIYKKDPSRISSNMLIALDDSPGTQERIKFVNAQLAQAVKEGKIKPEDAISYDSNNVLANYLIVDGKLSMIGHFPRKARIGEPVYDEKGNITGYKGTPNNKNQWIYNYNKATGRNLTPLNPELNNDNLGNAMRELGISVLEAPIVTMSPEGVYSNNPHLVAGMQNLNWLEAVAKNKGVPMQAEQYRTENMQAVQESLSYNASEYVEKMNIQDNKITNQLTDVLEKIETLLKQGDARALQTEMNGMLGKNFFDNAQEAQSWINNKYNVKVKDVIASWQKVNESGNLTKQGQLYLDSLANFFESNSTTKDGLQKLLMTPLLSKAPEGEVSSFEQKLLAQGIAEKIAEVQPMEGREIQTEEIKQAQEAIQEITKKPIVETAPKIPITAEQEQITIQEAIKTAVKSVAKEQPTGKMTMTMTAPKLVKTTMVTKAGIELGKEILPSGQYWLEQNVQKAGGKWTPVAKAGYKVEHLMDKQGYAGKIRINDKEFTYPEAERLFLKPILAGKILETPSIKRKPETPIIQQAVKQAMTMTMAETPPSVSEMRLYDVPSSEVEPEIRQPEVHETLDLKEQIQQEIEIPAEVIDIQPNNYRTFEDRINKGFNDLISNSQKEAYDAGDFEKVKSLELYKDKFSREILTAKAKEFYNQSPDEPFKALEKFENALFKSLKEQGLPNPFAKKPIFRTKLRRLFLELPHLEPRKTAIIKNGKIVEIADMTPQKSTYLTDLNRKAQKAGNLPDDAFEVLHLDAAAYEAGFRENWQQDRLSSVEKEEQIREAFKEKGYIPIGVSGADLSTFFGIKMVDIMPKLVAEYNKNLDNYKFIVDGDKDLSSISDIEKAERVYMFDVLETEKEMTHDKMMKRWKIVNDDDLINQDKGKIYRYLIVPSPKLQDIARYNEAIGKTLFSEGTTPQDKTSLLSRSNFDGKYYGTKPMVRRILTANGFTDPGIRNRIKGTAFYTWKENGENKMFMHKGDGMAMDKYHEDFFTKMIGRPIKDGDWITFTDNVKTILEGKQKIKKIINPQYKEGDPFSAPHYYEIEVPSEAHRIKYFQTIPNRSGKVSFPTSSIAKFLSNEAVAKDMSALWQPHIDKYAKLVSELNANFYDPKKIKEILKSKEYADFKIDTDSLYKRHKIKFEQGAGAKILNKQIDSILNRIWSDIITGRTFLKGVNLSFSPDTKVKLLPNGNRTLMDGGESMINKETAKIITGEEKSFTGIAWRNPGNKETNLMVVKFLIGEDNKINSLGREHAIVNSVDTGLRFDGDNDGDTLSIVKIGGKDGLPESLAEEILQIHDKQGEMILNIEAAKFTPKAPLSENFAEISQAMMLGSDGVRSAATSNRINPQLLDNKWKIKISPSTNKITVSYGDKTLTDGEFRELFNDKGQRTKISSFINYRGWKSDDVKLFKNLSDMEFSSKWDIKEKKITGYISQASVDAPKFPVLSQIGYDSSFLPARTLGVKTNQETRDKIVSYDETREMEFINNSKILNVIAPIVIKMNDLFKYTRGGAKIPNNKFLAEVIKKYNQTADYAKEGGANNIPLQAIMQGFNQFKPFYQVERVGISNPDINSAALVRSDIAATNAVKMQFNNTDMQKKLTSQTVKEFIQAVYEAREKYVGNMSIPKKQRGTTPAYNEVMKYFKDNVKRYGRSDLEAISYWATTDTESNIANSPHYTTPIKYIRRLDDLFIPEHAKTYNFTFEITK